MPGEVDLPVPAQEFRDENINFFRGQVTSPLYIKNK
jgi:hypothetical protein